MRAVVIGGSGQIGGWLLEHLRERGHDAVGTYASVAYPGLQALNTADPGAADWVADQRPDVVFYPAGFTWVDGCEREPQKAFAANRDWPLNIARAAVAAGSRFVYFSTDYLFDGREGPYAEGAATKPLNEYGRSKLEAERALLSECGDHVLIARTCWVYGPERQGKNFAYQAVRALARGKTLECPSDQYANPSYAPDIALAVVKLVEMGRGGVVHIAGPEWLNRVAFANAIARAFGLDASLVQGRPTDALAQGAPRPLKGGLRSELLEQTIPEALRPLETALAHFRGRVSDGPWRNVLTQS